MPANWPQTTLFTATVPFSATGFLLVGGNQYDMVGQGTVTGLRCLDISAYTQNISVALPANTRFYVVLQKEATSPDPPSSGSEVPEIRRQPEVPSVQELRELMDLRREINRMYQESSGGLGGVSQ